MGEISVSSLAVLGLAVAYSAVGLVDDYAKIKKKENTGLTDYGRSWCSRFWLPACLCSCCSKGPSSSLPQLWIPFTGAFVQLAVAAVHRVRGVIVGADNAVNLTDGIDGLAATLRFRFAIFFVFVGFRPRGAALGVVIFSAALTRVRCWASCAVTSSQPGVHGRCRLAVSRRSVAGLAFACEMPLVLLLVAA